MGRPRKSTDSAPPDLPGELTPGDQYVLALALAEFAGARPGWRDRCDHVAAKYGGSLCEAYRAYRGVVHRDVKGGPS
jgi:hypothetical protein